MLPKKSLIFPKLVYLREVKFASWSEDKRTGIYKLDWSHKDKYFKDKHDKWIENHWKDRKKEYPYICDLPEPYESKIKDLEFSIPKNYFEEIERTSNLSLIEWGKYRSFDTNIREMCLRPAISYVTVAFKLIADCLYDKEKNYFYRHSDKYIMDVALLYKFWMNQTGAGCVRNHSGLSTLENKINSGMLKKSWPELYNIEKLFFDTMNKYEEEVILKRSVMDNDENCKNQPSLGEKK